jgi:predicted nucleic acid-binding protein
MFDTGVLIRALNGQPDHPESPACRGLFEAMGAAGREVLIAAPTLAEYLRFGAPGAVPAVRGVSVAAFDDRAARFLGEHFPEGALHDLAKEHGLPKAYFKYDALIVACAKAHKADCLVTLDGKRRDGVPAGMIRLAEIAGVIVREPGWFLQAQHPLFGAGAALARRE